MANLAIQDVVFIHMPHNKNEIFENLFVLELANNHWGSIERGKKNCS